MIKRFFIWLYFKRYEKKKKKEKGDEKDEKDEKVRKGGELNYHRGQQQQLSPSY